MSEEIINLRAIPYDYNEDIEHRQQTMNELCKDVLEVNEMTKIIAVLVEKQGKQMNMIHDNIESSKNSVKCSVEELDRANAYKKKGNKIQKIIALIAGIVTTTVVGACAIFL